jgi:uncharacterized membrane protein YdjX (TVP38/TMEM64 family)
MRKKRLDPGLFRMIASFVLVISFLLIIRHLHFDQSILSALANSGMGKSEYAIMSFLFLASDLFSPVPGGLIIYTNSVILGFFGGFSLSLLSLLSAAFLGYYLAGSFSNSKYFNALHLLIDKLPELNIYILILSKAFPGFAELLIFWCGIKRFDRKRFILGNLVGYIPLCLFYSIFGETTFGLSLFWFCFIALIIISLGVFAYLKFQAYLKIEAKLQIK